MAGIRDITIYKGDTYTHEVRIKNSANTAINITGRTYKSQIRKSKASDEIVIAFTTTITDAANGLVTFSLTASNSANINVGTYYYDFEETNGAYVTTLMGGKVVIKGEVSRG